VSFFEIDHPANASLNATGIEKMGPRSNLQLIAVDLGERKLVDVLFEDENWDQDAPTIILAEGLLQYLPPQALQDLFTQCAAVCVDAIDYQDKEISIGGLEILTHSKIARIAFEILGAEPKIVYMPDWMRTAILTLARILTGSRTYGPIEFFLTVMAIDMVAPPYGKYTLKKYFTNLKQTRT
jgi:hypothetical protein